MLVQPSEVTPLMGLDRELTSGEQVAIRSILEDIEAEVRALIGGSIEVASYTETLTVPDPWPQTNPLFFYTSATPVQTVTSVTINTTLLDPSYYSFNGHGVKVYGGFTRSTLTPAYTQAATIAYTAGYSETVLAQIRPVVKRRAVRLVNKVGDEAIGTDRVSLEGYTSSWMNEAFTSGEVDLIRRAAGTHWSVSSPDTTTTELWFPGGSYGTVDWGR